MVTRMKLDERPVSSWKGVDDPPEGEYALNIDLRRYTQILKFKGLDIKPRAGSWNGLSTVRNSSPSHGTSQKFVIKEKEKRIMKSFRCQTIPPWPRLRIIRRKKTRKAKAKSCLFAGVSTTIFTRIMTLKSAKAIWDYLKGEYAGDERIRSMQVLNLMREFELQRMKESKTIKEYSDKLLSIANKIRLLGSDFADFRIVEKILVMVPERYEAFITSLENSKDLSKITLAEVLHALMAQEQRRLMREDRAVEGALPTKHHDAGYNKNKFS
ncbi:hypothetical protein CR513_12386, partial [Mucuna pruriens]